MVKVFRIDFFKYNYFKIKNYDVIISVHGVSNKILTFESKAIVDMVKRPKHFYERSYHNINCKRFDQKNHFFEEWS